jgi:acyl-CoA reductase-like NAD-dependent aldehyde dehydrogenase
MDSNVAVSRGADQVVARALGRAKQTSRDWAARPIHERLRIIRRARHLIARDCEALAALLGQRRPVAETLVSEILPLAEAARFLERRAEALLSPRIERRGRPLWLLGVRAEIRREPLGVVLILGPSNYPLFLPGAQMLQGLTAGNAVCVKPAPGCAAPLLRFAELLMEAGLPDGVLTILDDTLACAAAAVQAGFDRIVLTGSADTGRSVLQAAAARLTPTTMELSGNDAMFVLPGSDLELVASCLAYGLRLNGGATCLAPRRVFIAEALAPVLEQAVLKRIGTIAPAAVSKHVFANLAALLKEAAASGARVLAWPADGLVPPILVAEARPDLRLLRQDVFAPVVAIVGVRDMQHALDLAATCPYALGASIFGPKRDALKLAARVNAGSVVINDVIVPTADPRLPFGGRGESGFGVT